jgi:hypothetical protein
VARRELIAACALIGGLGGALFGYMLARTGVWSGWHWNLVVALTICTTISATLLGWFLARPGDAIALGARAAWATFVAGSLNGGLMAIATAFTERGAHGEQLFLLLCAAAVFGALCAIPFAPAIIITAMTAGYADARQGSIAAQSQGGRVLRNAMVCLAIAAVLITKRTRDPLAVHLPAYVMFVALALFVVLCAIELRARRALRPTNDAAWEPAADAPTDERVIDYGVGHGVALLRAHDETYRAAIGVTEVRRGDREAARTIVNASLRGHAIAAAAVAAALAITSASP